MAKKMRADAGERPRGRREQRFEPRPTVAPTVSYAVGAAGAVAMGAGAWAQFGPFVTEAVAEPFKGAPYMLFAGALIVAIAIWLGTSGEPALRVGDGGVGVEKSPLRRIPWHSVERIDWGGEAVRVLGKDQSGVSATFVARVATHPEAAAWIVKEGRERVPAVVDVPDDATPPPAHSNAPRWLSLDPVQVVGTRCSASGQIISYEPDARVCGRCERPYLKTHVPETCPCGANLSDLRARPPAG